MDGILNINKPPGKTSFDVVSRVKRLTGERRVGHAGTLDPAATGVLPISLGRAGRIIEFLQEATKTYRAQIELGVATDTYDESGQITQRGDASGINRKQFVAVLTPFTGLIYQTPPMYSAVKHQGKRLYQLARSGIQISRPSRPVEVHQLSLVDWQPSLATVEVTCSKGTYIRALAHDLGQALGCGAHLKNLIRSRYGIFDLAEAISIEQLEDACQHGYWQHFVHSPDRVLAHWAAIIVDDDSEQRIRNGCSCTLNNGPPDARTGNQTPDDRDVYCSGDRCRAYTRDGCFLGVLRFDLENRKWQPTKVFL
jgi:tRNA pseudouridine55 synthase